MLTTVALSALLAGAVGDADQKRPRTIEEINDLNANNRDDDDADEVDELNANNERDEADAIEGLNIERWPAASRKAAADMVRRYGEPDQVTDEKLIWKDAGGFKKIMVAKEATAHRFPVAHSDVLTYVVDYRVPASRFDELASFDGSVHANRTKGELSVSCDRHEMNLAALNLADDVIKGKKSVVQARLALSTVQRAVAAGKTPTLAKRLQFDGTRTATADADRPVNRAIGR